MCKICGLICTFIRYISLDLISGGWISFSLYSYMSYIVLTSLLTALVWCIPVSFRIVDLIIDLEEEENISSRKSKCIAIIYKGNFKCL